jgi:peptidoglycan/xylan/chitin deacetylase (PgdA/CDA1 family)
VASERAHTIVAAYHSIHAPEPGVHAGDVIAPPDTLARDARRLLDDDYRCITADELVAETNGRRPPGRTALLTFDDGWLDGLTVAAPLLERLGVRATFFVCPGLWGNHDLRLGEAGRVLTERDARELAATGMDLGAHSMTHPDLRSLGDDALRAEVLGSKAAVEALTGRPCLSFAYPFGLHDSRVRRAVAEAGFAVAFAFEPGPWRPLAAPRVPAPLLDQYAA